jgi:homopolymeric O-antigen transport system ATP-binding protein
MSDTAVRVRGLGKRYHVGVRRQAYATLRDRIADGAIRFGRRLVGRERTSGPTATIWALRELSFDVARGDVVGIIGGNGAGKSTLLKILSRITEPTEGEAVINGRVGALLEVGTGFHPELTGRENIFLNGAILGMTRAEVGRKFDAIVEFAGVSPFIDTPVRFYSSGMYVRLAFAVAAHMEPEILVIDEVLAVGDAQFQKRCLGKMNDVSREGRTILFVSHNLEAVQRLCNRGLLVDRGRLAAAGPIADVVARYRASEEHLAGLGEFRIGARRGTGWARIMDVRLMNGERAIAQRPADGDLVFEVDLALTDPRAGSLQGLIVELVLCSGDGAPLCSVMNVDDGGVQLPDGPVCTVRLEIAAPTFVPGRYRLNTFLGIPYLQHVDEVDDAFEFEIVPPRIPWRPYELSASRGFACRRAVWSVREGAAAACNT